jgi:hypothetical protein
MGVARAIITQHPMGRPLGAPGDYYRQRHVVEQALALLPDRQPAIIELPEPWRSGPA